MTMSRVDAEHLASEHLQAKADQRDAFVILSDKTIEDPLGWVFFYQSREFIETGKATARLVGNAPILVRRDTGELRVLGTARPVEDYLEAERARSDAP